MSSGDPFILKVVYTFFPKRYMDMIIPSSGQAPFGRQVACLPSLPVCIPFALFLVIARPRGCDQEGEKDRDREGERARERGVARLAKERMTISCDHRIPSLAVPEIQQTNTITHSTRPLPSLVDALWLVPPWNSL